MTVCALPSSDLQIRPTETPAFGGLDGRAQAGAAGADDEDVVGIRGVAPSEDPEVRQITPIEQRRM